MYVNAMLSVSTKMYGIGTPSISSPYYYFCIHRRVLTGPNMFCPDVVFRASGSVLVSAAHHGAFIWGSDIDFLTLHARTKPTRVNQVTPLPLTEIILFVLGLNLVCIWVYDEKCYVYIAFYHPFVWEIRPWIYISCFCVVGTGCCTTQKIVFYPCDPSLAGVKKSATVTPYVT